MATIKVQIKNNNSLERMEKLNKHHHRNHNLPTCVEKTNISWHKIVFHFYKVSNFVKVTKNSSLASGCKEKQITEHFVNRERWREKAWKFIHHENSTLVYHYKTIKILFHKSNCLMSRLKNNHDNEFVVREKEN